MIPTNELQQLLLNSLKQFSAEFDARQKQISEDHIACMTACNELSKTLMSQYKSAIQQFNVLETHYEQVLRLLQNLNAAPDPP